jgi:hypothetical protein
MNRERADSRTFLGIIALVGGFIALATVYAYHYWFFVRNPDVACFDRLPPHDVRTGSIDGVVTWLPGLTCNYLSTSGVAQTSQSGWIATVVLVAAVALVLVGVAILIANHAANSRSGSRKRAVA